MEKISRRLTRAVNVGGVQIGGDAPIRVQSMTNTPTADRAKTLRQIRELEEAGCEIIRLAIPDTEAVEALPYLVGEARVPLVADIHFDYRLAIGAIQAGVAKIRINPGNIGGLDRVQQVLRAAQAHQVAIRVGVNAGSIDPRWQEEGLSLAQAMVASAQEHIRLLEDEGFDQLVVSLKASDVPTSISACRLFAQESDLPLHLGITEAGTPWGGTIRSAVGLGAILADGIGETLRVSLTGDPVEEVRVAYTILEALELRRRGVRVISCPTCGRTQIPLETLALAVEERTRDIQTPLVVAVMGCVVNGPGEARGADLGIAGGRGSAVLFRKGEIVARLEEEEILERLLQEIRVLAAEGGEPGV